MTTSPPRRQGNALAERADYKATPDLGIGPFVMLSLGQFSNCSLWGPGAPSDCSIPDQALHEWLTIGLRGVYDVSP